MPLPKLALTIRHKVILAFIGINILMVLGVSFTLYNFSQTVGLGKEVIQIHQPAAINSLQLIKEVRFATSLVDEYLLTGDKNLKDQFFAQKKIIISSYQKIIDTNTGQAKTHSESVLTASTHLDNFFNYTDKLFHLRENDLENYPGIALASELTDPHTLAYLGLVNELVSSANDEIPVETRPQATQLLYELRYSWIQMNNAFRIFMLTRADNDLQNFYTYDDVNESAHIELRKLNVNLGFGALDQLESYRNSRMKNVPIVVKAFRSESWRKDIYIMRTEVAPLLETLNTNLQKFSDDQIAASVDDGNLLTGTLSHFKKLSVLLLLSGLVFSFSLTTIIVRNLKPIANLTTIAHNISINSMPTIDSSLLARSDEVGELANAFQRMSNNLADDIQQRNIAERKFETLLESSSDATVIVDTDGIIRFFNKQAELIFGYNKEEIIGKGIETLIPERLRKNHTSMRQEYMASPQTRPMDDNKDLYGLRKDGSEFSIEIGLAPIETTTGLLISASVRDVTDKKESQRQLIHQANYDLLTDLPNRVLALDRLSNAINIARRKKHSIAVMFIDLDNFKQVNDSLGHSVGDQLLQKVSRRLLDTVRANDTIARLGGDEFLVILPEVNDLGAVETIADKLIATIRHHYNIDERELFIGASIGITLYPSDGDDPEILLRNADAAMYQSKNAGRNTFRFFTQEMNAKLLYRLELESQLRTAIEKNELQLHYQPLYDLSKNRISGAETLLRWDNPALGKISPDVFITIAEETGIINKIGDWVLREACHAAMLWNKQVDYDLHVSVNISAMQFRGVDPVKIVSDALNASGLRPELLELEITERALVDDNLNVKRIMSDLKRLGVRLALDDFGTGYSSLGYLKRFHFDILKIDRIFVSDVIIDPETSALCKAIVAMADSLNLTVVAEGVESAQQLQFMRNLGVSLVQGFYLSKPVSNAEIIHLITQRNSLIRPV